MSRISSENYCTIQGWMVTDLGLKGNSLIIYAIINGFSQTEDQAYKGSLQYLADWTNSTKRGVINIINGLTARGLIEKKTTIVDGIKHCEYWVVKKVHQGDEKISPGGEKSSLPPVKKFHHPGEKSSPNNNKDNNSVDNKEDNKVDKHTLTEQQLGGEFELLWQKYPNKKGKPAAFKSYSKARKAGTSKKRIEDGIDAYKAYIETRHIEPRYIKHGSTWFNQQCWTDEYDTDKYAEEERQINNMPNPFIREARRQMMEAERRYYEQH